MKTIDNLQVGETLDWKFGLITRTIERTSNAVYAIHDTSDGWYVANVDKPTLDAVLTGKKSLSNLEWK